MAEAIVNARYGNEWKAYSAGTKPAGHVHLKAIQALNEIGIAHVGRSKHVDDLPTKDFDLVVTVCDSAAEECPVWPGKAGKRVHHGFVDPAKTQGNAEQQIQAFRQVRGELVNFIAELLK
jgi:arsenate reductase (thioredoxin)